MIRTTFTLLLFLVAFGWSNAGEAENKVALLIGISDYPASGGWAKLHTETDLARIRGGLEAQGFAPGNIHTVTDKDADRAGIEAAFREHLLERVGRGSVAFFHYSGHGQRITDDNFDEVDGYDEALVPHDAPQRLRDDYDGSKHLRDDILHEWLQQLREKIGPQGDIVISLDSCFSGAATRGQTPRGSLEPLGAPQVPEAGKLGADRGGGFVEGSSSRGVSAAGADGAEGKLAPFIVFSSARHDELAFETRDENGQPIGSLSFALGSALSRAGTETTYKELHDQVKRTMAGQVRNRPQLEGQPDRRILGGSAVSQKPFHEIVRYDAEGKIAQVKGGALAGLLKGSKVAVYPAGTRDLDSATALATGSVRKSRSLTSEVAFDTVAEGAEITEAWLFVTEPAFGDVRVSVHIGAGEWRGKLVEQLESRKLVEQVEDREGCDVVIEEGGRGIDVYRAVDDTLLSGPLSPKDRLLAVKVRQALEDFARNRWLRRVEASSADIKVRMEIRPCLLEQIENDFGDTISTCGTDLDRMTEGGDLDVRIGDAFELKLINEGRKDAYISVLDLMPDGRIELLYPARDEMGEDNKLKRGKSFVIPTPFVVQEPLGNEMLKLFATSAPVDFRPILSGNFNPNATRGVLDKFMGGAFDGTRASPTVAAGPVSTQSLPFTVSPAGEAP